MAHLIDKDALVAEIERRMQCYSDNGCEPNGGKWVELISIKHFIDALKVKEVDLEKEMVEWHKEHFKKDGTFIGMSGFYLTNNSQMDIAKHFFELGIKTKQD